MSRHGLSIAHLGITYKEVTGDEAPSKQTIYAMTLQGEIPAAFIDGRWYVLDSNKPIAIEAIRKRRHPAKSAA